MHSGEEEMLLAFTSCTVKMKNFFSNSRWMALHYLGICCCCAQVNILTIIIILIMPQANDRYSFTLRCIFLPWPIIIELRCVALPCFALLLMHSNCSFPSTGKTFNIRTTIIILIRIALHVITRCR